MGLIIGIHPLFGFLFGIFISKYMMTFGRRTVMLVSIMMTILTLVAMGLTWYLRFD